MSEKDPTEFQPVCREHTNKSFIGEHGIELLPVTDTTDSYNSIWVMPSIWQRIKFLFHGEVTLRVMGRSQPPVCIVAGDVIRRALEESARAAGQSWRWRK